MKFINNSHLRKSFFVILSVSVYAALAQWVIASGSALLVLTLPGLFVGYYLFNKPFTCFWVIFFTALLAGPFVSYVPGLFNLRWGINLLAIFLGISILLRIVLRHRDVCVSGNTIFTIFGLLILWVVLSSIINNVPAKQLIIAVKNNFQFFPLFLFFLFYSIPQNFCQQIEKALMAVALVQPPLVLFQYFFIVPKVKSLTGVISTEVLDAVNGSFGTSLKGGGTGIFTFWSCLLLSGLIAAYSQKIITKGQWVFLSLYLLFPMFLNETKAGFLFLLAGSMVVIISNKGTGNFKKILLGVFAISMAGMMVWTTLQMSVSFGTSKNKVFKDSLSYNIGQRGYGHFRLNRLTTLTFWLQINRHEPLALLIGHGLDSTVEGDVGLSDPGSIARRYPFYGTGLTTASQMLWETGVIGLALWGAVLILAFYTCIKLSRNLLLSKHEQVIVLSIAAGIFLIGLSCFYNSMFRNSQAANFIFTLLICMAIYVKKQHNKNIIQESDANDTLHSSIKNNPL